MNWIPPGVEYDPVMGGVSKFSFAMRFQWSGPAVILMSIAIARVL